MDIAIDKPLQYQDLKTFLEEKLSIPNLFLLYEGLNDWDDATEEQMIFQYLENHDLAQGFKYGLSLHVQLEPLLPVIENLAESIAQHFSCSAICDASRIILKEQNVYYSLLFENQKVFLVEDHDFEETGNVVKVVELNYQCPTVEFK